MKPGTTETKSESERLFIQPAQKPSTNSDDSRLSSPKILRHREREASIANREKVAGRKEHQPLKCPSFKDEGEDEHLSLNESLESDEETPIQGWLGNEDQVADLVLILRWAHAYRVSIEGAGRMLNMKPEIVDRALIVHAQPPSDRDPNLGEGAVVRRAKPVIKHWVRLELL